MTYLSRRLNVSSTIGSACSEKLQVSHREEECGEYATLARKCAEDDAVGFSIFLNEYVHPMHCDHYLSSAKGKTSSKVLAIDRPT